MWRGWLGLSIGIVALWSCSISIHAQSATGGIRAEDSSAGFQALPIAPQPSARVDPEDQLPDGNAQPGLSQLSADPNEEEQPYNWKGLLLQSLAFNMIENGFRLAQDDSLRELLVHKPFWHDYIASLKQYNMRRWNDGDSFLVNYIGHGMHGAIPAFIAIQNSSKGKKLQWGEPGYVRSRMYASLWSIAYSTQSEIGPLGEAGIGSQGGYTYGVKCVMHCNASNYKTGDKYTNNTGWTDFIITPTVGMLWVMGEDAIDKEISNRIQGDDRSSILPKIIRGTLNPNRTMANFLRWKKPWYRDWDPYTSGSIPRVHFLPLDEQVAVRSTRPRYRIAPYYSSTGILGAKGCNSCKRRISAGGVEAEVRMTAIFSAVVDVNFASNASPYPTDRSGGNMLRAFFGVNGGVETTNYALRLGIRPGLVHFTDAYLSSPSKEDPTPQTGGITHWALDFLLEGDYKLSQRFAIRAGIEDTIVRYRSSNLEAPGYGTTPPYLSWLSRENYLNRSSWSYRIGPVFSF